MRITLVALIACQGIYQKTINCVKEIVLIESLREGEQILERLNNAVCCVKSQMIWSFSYQILN